MDENFYYDSLQLEVLSTLFSEIKGNIMCFLSLFNSPLENTETFSKVIEKRKGAINFDVFTKDSCFVVNTVS